MRSKMCAQGRTERRGIVTVVAVGLLVAALSAPGAGAATAAGQRPSKQVDLRDVQLSPVPDGNGIPQRSATAADARAPLPDGYTETEYLFAGTATLYAGKVTGPVTVESDGHAFTTRILVRTPAAPADFSGTVWIEPLNTTGGGGLDAIWGSIAPLVGERGDAWVGVTVRAGQVERLQGFDAVRYAEIDFDANGYAWDILRKVGALVKTNGPKSPLDELRVEHILMVGYSQSGVDSSTFALALHDATRLRNGAPVYDGYLLGARESNLTPLQSGHTIIPDFEHAKITGVDVPVVGIEPQSDVEGFAVEIPTALAQSEGVAGAEDITTPTFTYTTPGAATVRRPESNKKNDHFRMYEITGASHGTGPSEGCIGSTSFPIQRFTRAAAANLATWAEGDVAPPKGPRIELAVDDVVSDAAVDELGLALGGVRSPYVDVPLSTYEVHSRPGPLCNLRGIETLLTADVLIERYGDAEGYMKQFTKSLDATIKAGYLLALDRALILEEQEARATVAFATT